MPFDDARRRPLMSRGDRRRRFRIARRKVGSLVLPVVAPTLLRVLSRSWRLEEIGRERFESAAQDGGVIVVFWHGRMLLPISSHAHSGFSVLVSPSDDGSLVKGLLKSFGYEVIRGSSNKNAARAARELLERLQGGGRIALTPDGPRGPRHSMNPGPAWLAKLTGLPVVPMGFGVDRARYLKSWDRFTIPRFGARIAIVYGDPLRLPADASDADIASATGVLRERLLAAEEQGFGRVQRPVDW